MQVKEPMANWHERKSRVKMLWELADSEITCISDLHAGSRKRGINQQPYLDVEKDQQCF